MTTYQARIEEMVEARARAVEAKRCEMEARAAVVTQLTDGIEQALRALIEEVNARAAELGLGDGITLDVSVSNSGSSGVTGGRADFWTHQQRRWTANWAAKDGTFVLELPDVNDDTRRTSDVRPAYALPELVVKSALTWLTKWSRTHAI